MARSPSQIALTARVIMIASLTKEFRKSAIISKIISIAKNKGMEVTGDLANPKGSGSITPSSDDRWFIKRESLQVFVGPIAFGVPSYIRFKIAPNYEISKKYFYLTEQSDNKKWFPNVNRIKEWVRKKGIANSAETSKVAWAIAKSIAKKGIKKTNLANPFFYKNTGVSATIERGARRGMARVSELYRPLIIQQVDKSFSNIFEK